MSCEYEYFKGRTEIAVSCISFTLAFLSFFGCLTLICSQLPDDFMKGGKYFDIFPVWMNFVYFIGVVATSLFVAFLVYGISFGIFNIRKIRMWINISKCKFNTKRTYKF